MRLLWARSPILSHCCCWFFSCHRHSLLFSACPGSPLCSTLRNVWIHGSWNRIDLSLKFGLVSANAGAPHPQNLTSFSKPPELNATWHSVFKISAHLCGTVSPLLSRKLGRTAEHIVDRACCPNPGLQNLCHSAVPPWGAACHLWPCT